MFTLEKALPFPQTIPAGSGKTSQNKKISQRPFNYFFPGFMDHVHGLGPKVERKDIIHNERKYFSSLLLVTTEIDSKTAKAICKTLLLIVLELKT